VPLADIVCRIWRGKNVAFCGQVLKASRMLTLDGYFIPRLQAAAACFASSNWPLFIRPTRCRQSEVGRVIHLYSAYLPGQCCLRTRSISGSVKTLLLGKALLAQSGCAKPSTFPGCARRSANRKNQSTSDRNGNRVVLQRLACLQSVV